MPMWIERKGRLRWAIAVVVGMGIAASAPLGAAGLAAEPPTGRSSPDLRSLGLPGGLCAEIGCGDPQFAPSLAGTGRFLVQLLDRDPQVVAAARELLESQGLYGLVSVVRLDSAQRLPYTENLVNLALVRGCAHGKTPLAEVARVVCPGGLALMPADWASETAIREAGLETVPAPGVGPGWLVARKRWPADMDPWTHPWHSADGNTVSQDRLVGPPRRIRWISGPEEEISSMVTCAGRNYYGGVWARDAFNGLRLWEQDLRPSPAQGGFGFKYTAGSVRPVAIGDRLAVLTEGVVCALDGATGNRVRSYPEAGRPNTLLHANGKLLAVGAQEIRALDADSGGLLWKHSAAEPRYVVATDRAVFLLEGNPRRGEKQRAVCLDLASGEPRWQQDSHPWLAQVRRLVAHGDLLAFEVSTLADAKEGNAIHVASAADGRVLWSRQYVPGMNHMKQSRAMFIGDTLWVLEHLQCVALDPRTGEVRQKHPAGLCHCFPPVATPRFMFSGEMDLTDLATGQVDANRITKAACSRDFGWIPANGLIYTAPKHCVCWPMLRGYTALAPESPGSKVREVVDGRRFTLEKGDEAPASQPPDGADWPCYRHDAWRSGATPARAPAELKTLWTTHLGTLPEGEIARDWRENPFVRGPITAPVAAGALVYVARPDAHQVVAMDMKTGGVRWRFTADGRVDTPPTIHGGMCLFGTRCGSVYALRAHDGGLVWRLRAAPSDEQIVAHGQVESPWPVPGSVLVIDDAAYFAAGRQPLADGGILLFAVEPATGAVRWVKRLDTLPMNNFYACVGLEFDNFDLLHREGDHVAMSRWLFDRHTGAMVVQAGEAFARLQPGRSGVVVQRGVWTFAPRHLPRFDPSERLPRPLAVFCPGTLVGCLKDQRTLYRRDFDAESLGQFDAKWITGWAASENFRKKTGEVWPVDRLARQTKWSAPLLRDAERGQRIAALALAGDRLLAASTGGKLHLVSLEDGRLVGQADVPAPLWDGMAIASERVLISTAEGHVVCLGKP